MRAGETLRLSRHEAVVLAERHGGEAANEMALPEESARGLVSTFERELELAFERAHASEEGAPLLAELEAAARRILESSRTFLDAQQQAALGAYLESLTGPGPP